MNKLFLIFLLALSFSACNNTGSDTDPSIMTPHTSVKAPENINYTLLSQYPHDTSSYTQGLELHDGKMYEGSGDFETSSLRITDYKTGAVLKKHMMGSAEIFGEGITIFNNKIYQLTWKNNIVYVYDLSDITKVEKTIKWPYQGWGITHNATDLIISDGSANLYFVDPETFKVKNSISVSDNNGPVMELNELEFVNGFIYANVYETYKIVKIDPESGHVKSQMILSNLLDPKEIVEGRTDWLNGIAYDSTKGTLLITGKRWPKMFELKLN